MLYKLRGYWDFMSPTTIRNGQRAIPDPLYQTPAEHVHNLIQEVKTALVSQEIAKPVARADCVILGTWKVWVSLFILNSSHLFWPTACAAALLVLGIFKLVAVTIDKMSVRQDAAARLSHILFRWRVSFWGSIAVWSYFLHSIIVECATPTAHHLFAIGTWGLTCAYSTKNAFYLHDRAADEVKLGRAAQ